MNLDERLWVFGYKMASESAKLLAEKLDVWMIRHEGSTWHGKKGQYVLNWGAGTGVYCAHTGYATILNRPELIDIAVNKWSFFRRMRGDNAPRCPFWTTDQEQAKAWLAGGETLVARTRLEGAKGDGIVVINKPVDFVPAPLYTIKVDIQSEYRVYMFDGDVIDVRQKLLAKNGIPDPNGMRYGEQYEFCQMQDLNEMPADCWTQAKRAINKLGLFTCGLDVIWDGKKAWVLEANSAPYLGEKTAIKYANAIKKYVETR